MYNNSLNNILIQLLLQVAVIMLHQSQYKNSGVVMWWGSMLLQVSNI